MDLNDFKILNKEKESDKDVKRIKGIITAVSQKESEKGKRFGIRLDNVPELEFKWVNGFGSAPGIEGDEVEFEYTITNLEDGRTFYNVKRILGINETHSNLTEKDQKMFQPANELIKVEQNNDAWNRATNIMSCAVNICIKRNTMSDGEIIAMYNKLFEWISEQSKLNEQTETLRR